MKSNIITLKIKYVPADGDVTPILSYMKNYNNVLRFTYNRIQEGIVLTKELTELQHSLNNIFIDSHFKNSAIYQAKAMMRPKAIFGGKKLFFDRMSGKIGKEEYQLRKVLPICSIGEANKKANRKFKILDADHVLFKPNKSIHICLRLISQGKSYKKKLERLISLQEAKQIAITYKLDLEYIYLSFDNSILEQSIYEVRKNRIIAVDMNPNYLGYSVVDWLNENEYKVVDEDH